MKVTIEIDCTPEEARRFMGMPDLAPVHALYVDQLKQMLTDGVSPDMMQSLMKQWAPMGEAGFGMWRQLFDRAGKPAA